MKKQNILSGALQIIYMVIFYLIYKFIGIDITIILALAWIAAKIDMKKDEEIFK